MKTEEFDLENLPRKNIFKIPENYFEELSSTIEQRSQSVIEKLPKENIFKVPQNYFEQLESNILAQTTQATKIIPLITWSAKRTWASVAACSAIAVLGFFTLMPQQDSLGSESLAGVQNHEIVNYLIQENFNQADITEQINNGKIIRFKDSELLDNLKVTDNEILQNIDFENIDSEI